MVEYGVKSPRRSLIVAPVAVSSVARGRTGWIEDSDASCSRSTTKAYVRPSLKLNFTSWLTVGTTQKAGTKSPHWTTLHPVARTWVRAREPVPEPVHEPAWHWSVTVQAFPSSQAVPSGLAGLLHIPVVGSQVPASWHWSSAVQVTGLVPMHCPDSHASLCVQAFPSLQVVPSGFAGLLHIPVVGSQVPAS